LYKSQKNKAKIKAPIKPREKPKPTMYGIKERGVTCELDDENKWVWDICADL